MSEFSNFKGDSKIVILDDSLNEANSKDVCNILTTGSQHTNIRVTLITQNFFTKVDIVGTFHST
jgi:hypothetical protein